MFLEDLCNKQSIRHQEVPGASGIYVAQYTFLRPVGMYLDEKPKHNAQSIMAIGGTEDQKVYGD